MESQVRAGGHRGFILITVLIVTAVGLMFGAGALLLFRFQCQQRIERQHELEKVYAVRSALNWARTYNWVLPNDGVGLKYNTGSERALDLLVKPVACIFPDLNFESNNVKHLIMDGVPTQGSGGTSHSPFDKDGDQRLLMVSSSMFPHQYNSNLDYEYGMMVNVLASDENDIVMPDLTKVEKVDDSFITNIEKSKNPEEVYGLSFPNSTTNNVKWWVNIGMLGTGGWLHEIHGRRYYFQVKDFLTDISSDVLHLCIIRGDKHHPENAGHPGCQHGWPLSSGEKALVLKFVKSNVTTTGTSDVAAALLELYEYIYGKVPRLLARHASKSISYKLGVQIADRKVSLFWFDGAFDQEPADILLGESEISEEMYSYFRLGSEIDDEDRILTSPDLRVVFEVFAVSGSRGGSGEKSNAGDFLHGFQVRPAYQYDVFLKCPNVKYDDVNGDLATVVQLIPKTDMSIGFPAITYDTHGTEHKGFRYDERHSKGNRNW